MQQILIMLPILAYAAVTALALVYVLALVIPRMQRARQRPGARDGARQR
jgi:hypothetical protein